MTLSLLLFSIVTADADIREFTIHTSLLDGHETLLFTRYWELTRKSKPRLYVGNVATIIFSATREEVERAVSEFQQNYHVAVGKDYHFSYVGQFQVNHYGNGITPSELYGRLHREPRLVRVLRRLLSSRSLRKPPEIVMCRYQARPWIDDRLRHVKGYSGEITITNSGRNETHAFSDQ